ncbi:hypothetical protein SpCBS45565_g05193 [Spizellomyces sp. 'palustris']|nr:hypothetical protein SpCBS45565_g05193 [Spizellomyces sp. 'palustris']
MGSPTVHTFFDGVSSTCTYVVVDVASREAVIIDPVLGFTVEGAKIDTKLSDELLAFVQEKQYNVVRILETHAHADHLTSAQYLKLRLGGSVPVCIGEGIAQVQRTFARKYALPPCFPTDGSQFDCLLRDNDTFNLGTTTARAIATPGHTPDSMSFLIGDILFCGDLLFMPDVGTARCDFPGGSAKDMYKSIRNNIYALDESIKVYVGHDYAPPGREASWESTVAIQRQTNKQVSDKVTEEEFIAWREGRDSTLGPPRLLHYSLQVNIAAGHLPEKEGDSRFFRVPINSVVEF